MRETVTGEYSIWRGEAPPDAMAAAAEFASGLSAISQIVWGEHCSECDYPRCFSTCAFYDPRPDLQCRRFAGGVEGSAGGLTRIRFRRWGKFEGQGPATLWPRQTAQRRLARDEALSRALSRAPLPWTVRDALALRFNQAKRRMPNLRPVAADAFVVAGWLEDGPPRHFTLTFLQDGAEPRMFQAAFELGEGFRRFVTPVSAIAARIDLSTRYRVQIEPVGEAEGVNAVFSLTDFVAFAKSPSTPDAATNLVKVVVWDLDETLWNGTLAEDGLEGVALRPEAAAAVRALDAKGVLNSIASKNDEAEALAALRHFGLHEFFLHPQIGWGPKSTSVARIAAALDLGLDAFAFIDDQPFERAEVCAVHPAVRALPETAVEGLADHAWFDHPVTAESAGRRALYQAEADRTRAAEAAEGDYLGFLRGSGLTLTIGALGPTDAERVFELSQRTNQLNFTAAKFTRDAVLAMCSPDPAHARLVLRCADRFGDYGLIGFADLDLAAGELAAFFMSCRVQRKRVEHAAFRHFAGLMADAGHSNFAVRFRPSARNGASVAMLSDLGFTACEAGGEGAFGWDRPLAKPFEDSDIVAVAPAAGA